MNDTLSEILSHRTHELVSIPSPSGREQAIADHVERFLERETSPSYLRRFPGAVVAAYGWGPSDERGGVVLAGHLDTVPDAGHPEPSRDDTEVVGLGSTDMKGGIAVMMTLAANHAAGSAPVGFVFYDREEVSFEDNGLGPLLQEEPWLGGARLAVLLEPTDNVLELGCQGSLHATVTFHGVAAHSARPWMGENAIHKAGRFLAELSDRQPRDVVEGPAVFREVLLATLAESGGGRNVVPDRFTLNVNLRFPPDRTIEDAESFLRSQIPVGVTAEIVDLAPAAPARTDAPIVQMLMTRFGLKARAKQAWTDVARFAALGVPAVNFGPGKPELAHRRDERVPVANLVHSYEVLSAFGNSLEDERS